tara:strand:+ start:167 stop:703 length:537 start_codon:yes stop_codon:yes gene_type:complete
MKTQKVQIETIKLDPSNPRSITKEAFERLKKSITDFPEMQSVKPLVVADGYALAGNMRLLAYKDLGYRELHVLDVSEWSQAKRDEFMIKDNTHYGTWDYDALANEWDNLPLNEWGMEVWEQQEEPEFEDLIGEIKDKPATLKITFKTPEQLQKAEIDIQELLDRKYLGAYFSVSAGEI